MPAIPSVLDAWVEVHADTFQNEFRAIENVEARRVFIPSPVTLDGRTIAAVTSQDLDGLFARPILIWGEGGVGKTSLACKVAEWSMAQKQSERICKHRMLPILLEEDLEGDPESCQESLLESILGHLKLLTRADQPISKELLDNLLRRRRVMVIVLRYLEERLLLIQTIGASKDQIRFSLDPLAEYLAALRLLELNDGSEEQWLSFLAEAQSKPGCPVSIAGFLSAVQDCWLTKGKPAWRLPNVVATMMRVQGAPALGDASSLPDPHTLPRGPRSTAPA